MPFIMLGSFLQLLRCRVFYQRGCGILSRAACVSVGVTPVSPSLLLTGCITPIGFHGEPPLLSWDNSLDCGGYSLKVLGLVCCCFVGKFCIQVHKGHWSLIFFLCGIFVWLW